MSVWFTSDLHLGHERVAPDRGFTTIAEHDWQIIENINKVVNKRDKLFILGDFAFTDKGFQQAYDLRCQNIELILGNHDVYPTNKYRKIVQKIHGFRGYKSFWLSHCPIHPNEMRKKTGNLHGHIHKFGDTDEITDPRYFNVNIEYHSLGPVSFIEIEKHFESENLKECHKE